MPRLEVADVSVRFGGLAALRAVSLDVQAGEITGLIGPNGAGKTTLFNTITGLQRPSSGRILFDGADVTAASPNRRARLGMARTFQRLEAFGSLSVQENVLVAAEMSGSASAAAAWADDLMERVGLVEVADERVDNLPTGTARLVELARALALRPRLLLLDEPSSGLDQQESEALAALLRDLVDETLAVLLVEHDMPLVMSTCAHIHVLDFGRTIASGTPAEIAVNPAVVAAYLGDDDAEPAPRRRNGGTDASPDTGTAPRPDEGPAIELTDVHAGYGDIQVLHGIDLTVRTGEVFAVLGTNGAGKSTLLKVLSGEVRPIAGGYAALGADVVGAPADALARAGICTIPEGRGVFRNLTVQENLRMVTHGGTGIAEVEERAYAQFPRLAERRTQIAGTMSGGEQQMLALARALATRPRILLIDELSMGLAPLIVEELYEVVATIARNGVTTVVVEQFAHDVLPIADRAAVMAHGRIGSIGDPGAIADLLAGLYLGDEPTPSPDHHARSLR
jgi:ABC-type branched-subunit amino acid transport system ATPase component